MNKNNWEYVKEKIITSKVYRFDYKALLGESLTSFITKRNGRTEEQILVEILCLENVKRMFATHPQVKVKFCENVLTSIHARRAEQKTHLRRLSK